MWAMTVLAFLVELYGGGSAPKTLGLCRLCRCKQDMVQTGLVPQHKPDLGPCQPCIALPSGLGMHH